MRFFPSAGSSHLERYAQLFNACEINSSFYRPHKIETWERWRDSVPDGFLFSVKAPKAITHESELDGESDLLPSFLRQISFLNEKLGPILFQLPPRREFNLTRAVKFLETLRQQYSGDVVWETRHPSWFISEVEDLLQTYRVARAAVDPACVPSAAEPGGHFGTVYFRLHGSPRRYYSSYADDFLDKLAARMRGYAAEASVWCIFDNTASGAAIPNAVALRQR